MSFLFFWFLLAEFENVVKPLKLYAAPTKKFQYQSFYAYPWKVFALKKKLIKWEMKMQTRKYTRECRK